MTQWFNAKREKGSKSASVRIYDQIGESWFGDSTSAKGFTQAIDGLGEDLETLNIYINSPGGNVYDGLAIYNFLKRHSAKVVVHVDGIAASIASIIAMAGDQVIMPANSNMFIHNPWTFAGGDAASLRKTADELDAMRASLVGIYMSRVNISEEDVIAMMDDETLLTAEESVAWGFADEMTEETRMAASTSPIMSIEHARLQAGNEAAMASVKAQLQAAQEARDEFGAQLAEAKDEISNLEAMLADIYKPEPEMPAEDVIDMVAEANCPEWLATQCILEGFGETDVQERVAEYSAIRDTCVAAGVQDPDAICRDHLGNAAAVIAALLVEALADDDADTQNRIGLKNGPVLDYQKAYANRKPQVHR